MGLPILDPVELGEVLGEFEEPFVATRVCCLSFHQKGGESKLDTLAQSIFYITIFRFRRAFLKMPPAKYKNVK